MHPVEFLQGSHRDPIIPPEPKKHNATCRESSSSKICRFQTFPSDPRANFSRGIRC